MTAYVIIGLALGAIAYAGYRADRQARLDQVVQDAQDTRAAARWRASCKAVSTYCPVYDGHRQGPNYKRHVNGKQLR